MSSDSRPAKRAATGPFSLMAATGSGISPRLMAHFSARWSTHRQSLHAVGSSEDGLPPRD